jgi:hypothetical protein
MFPVFWEETYLLVWFIDDFMMISHCFIACGDRQKRRWWVVICPCCCANPQSGSLPWSKSFCSRGSNSFRSLLGDGFFTGRNWRLWFVFMQQKGWNTVLGCEDLDCWQLSSQPQKRILTPTFANVFTNLLKSRHIWQRLHHLTISRDCLLKWHCCRFQSKTSSRK